MSLKLRRVRVDCGYSSASSIISFVLMGRISEALLEPTIKTLSFEIIVTLPLFSSVKESSIIKDSVCGSTIYQA